jgi:hypothetical protein
MTESYLGIGGLSRSILGVGDNFLKYFFGNFWVAFLKKNLKSRGLWLTPHTLIYTYRGITPTYGREATANPPRRDPVYHGESGYVKP